MLSSKKTQSWFAGALVVLMVVQHAEAGRKLHVVIAADISDASIGRYCQTDANKVRTLFQNNVHHQEVEIHEVATSNINQVGINQVLQNARIRPEDAVVFYYSGHGNYARNGQHYMVVSGNWTARSAVIASMKSRGAGLAVLVTDSCFNFNDVDPPERRANVQMRMAATAPLFRKLFFETNGFVDINSCQRDEKAATHADYSLGSVFTKAMVDCMGTKSNMETETWQSIVNEISQETSRQFGLLHPDGETLETGDGNFVNQRSQTVARLAMNVFGHDPGPGIEGGGGPAPGAGSPIETLEFDFNIHPRTGRTTEQQTKYVFYPNTGQTRTYPGPLKSLGKASIVKASDGTKYWRWPRVKNPDVIDMEPVYVQAILSGPGGSPGGDGGRPDGMIADARLGILVKNHSGSGVMIRRVDAGGPATRCLGSDGKTWRLEAGDQITHINGQPIENTRAFTRAVRNSPSM
ncbi:MAG: caspase family protein, partial [Planctomycetaceae bacterium]